MIPRILAACTLERYRTLSHNTLEELGLPRRPIGVNRVGLADAPTTSVLPLETDILRAGRHVSNGPQAEVTAVRFILVAPDNFGRQIEAVAATPSLHPTARIRSERGSRRHLVWSILPNALKRK